ncbi:MAG: bifunctional riboflavin kinase/FAD synthetase, partial [Prolixibacteraceae bacterium]|nr:bifunctional riboflavin kinase/FAD synthetase [Prolixibacteraceae bacterium]
EIAQNHNGETVLFTFSPHPRFVVSPNEKNLRLITTLEEKKELLSLIGIDHLVVYPFTKEFSKMPYSDFVKNILVDKLNTRFLVVGYDHRFGKNREGGFEFLSTCAEKYNFKIKKLDAFILNDIKISSSRIREALDAGNIEKANAYLGYNFTLHGKVVEGKKLGRKIGFPTANIESSDVNKIIPGYGVYAVRIRINGETFNGMLNIGTRPTFNQNADNRSIEVNIFDFEQNIYGKSLILEFVKRIREERHFKSPEELIEQLHKDKIVAAGFLRD